jgi:glycosyltransferase involved in cell wall biosynthesis
MTMATDLGGRLPIAPASGGWAQRGTHVNRLAGNDEEASPGAQGSAFTTFTDGVLEAAHMADKMLLPIAIMAHNEERFIGRALESAVSQEEPRGYRVEIVVVANGCTDGTERVVESMASANPGRIRLIASMTKGKAHALEQAQQYVAAASIETSVPYVVMLDADCFFDDSRALLGCLRSFEDEPGLCAVAAQCLPALQLQFRSALLRHVYRAIAQLSEWHVGNSISGGGYCIRAEPFLEARFPPNVAEDMYLSSWLDGWMYRNPAVRVYYQPSSTLTAEIRKRIRQEVYAENYHRLYRETVATGRRFGRAAGVLDTRYRWTGPGRREIVDGFWRLDQWGDRLGLVMHAGLRAACGLWVRKLRRGGRSGECEWGTERGR